MRRLYASAFVFALLAFVAIGGTAADSSTVDFESGFSPGNINGQGGWSRTGSYDSVVADVSSFANASGFGFDTQALRISNAVTSGAFGDQTFAPQLTQPAGEAGMGHYDASFDLGSTLSTQQSGLFVSISPDDGSGGRMSYLGFDDQADGIHVIFYDVDDPGPLGTVADFVAHDVATVDRTSAHRFRLAIDFVPGPHNDVARIYVDGVLKITGTTWEDYYRYDPEQNGNGNVVPETDTMIFRAGGPAAPATSGDGYLIDNFSYATTPLCTTDCYVDTVGGDDSNGGTSVGDAKKTIQAGIDVVSSGGTVHVAAGTYQESPRIDKSLALQSTDGRDSTTIELQTGPTYLGALQVSAGDDVTIDGFTIQGRDAADPTLASSNILLDPGLGAVEIMNNRIQVGAVDGGSNGDDGFGLLSTYTTTLADEVDSVDVHDNIFEPLASAGQRVFFVNPGVNHFTFQDNTITGNFAGTAISQARDGQIVGNMLAGNGSSRGFGSWGYPDPTVYGKTTYSANNISDVATAISLYETSDVTVTHNVIHDVTNAVTLLDCCSTAGVVPGSNHVNDNSISAVSGDLVSNDYSGAIDASANWWGSNDESAIDSAMSGNVDFTPFLDSGTDTSGDPGFQGAFDVLDVTALGQQTGASGRIQEGVDLASGSIVNVGPGLYGENVVVGDTVDLRGAQYGVAFGSRTFADAAESTLNGQLQLNAADISVDGFSIKNHVAINSSAIGLYVKAAASGSSIANNIVGDILADFTGGSQAHAEGIYLENGPDDVTVSDNLIDGVHGWASSQAIYVGDSTASNASTGILIESNSIKNVTSDAKGAYGIMTNNATGAGLTISDNLLDNLTGGWVHAIAFEGPAADAQVDHNTVTNLNSAGVDRIAVWFEDSDPSFASATVTRNSLAVGNDRYGVVVHPSLTSGSVDATCNWWGDADGPGSAAGSDTAGNALVAPWLLSNDLDGDCSPISVDAAAADATGDEGDVLSTSGSFAGDIASITADNLFGTFTDNHDGTWSWSYTPTDQFSTVTVTVTGHGSNGSTADDQFDTSAANVDPTATFNAPASALYSSSFNISLSGPSDPSSADTTAGFTYAFDCGSGYGATSASSSASCNAPASPGSITVKGKILDKDGGFNEYTASVEITQPEIQLTPSSHDYGSLLVGGTSAPFTFTVKNVGTSDLSITGAGIGGTNPGYFGIDTNNCDLAVLAPNDTCPIKVFFNPTTSGPKSARLEVDSDDPNTPTAQSDLTGTGGTPSNGTITIVLDAHPNSSQQFHFTGTLATFNLEDDGTPANTTQYSRPAGIYTVKVATVARWALIGLNCDASEAITFSKRKVAINLHAGEHVTCTFIESYRVPDAAIALNSGGPYSGEDIYSNTVIGSQTLSQAIAKRQTKSFWVYISNDGPDSDTFKIFSTLIGSTHFRVWFLVGATDVTAQVNAGTYKVTMASGAQMTMEIRVRAKPRTKASDYRNIDLSVKSTTTTSAKDVVRAHVTRV